MTTWKIVSLERKTADGFVNVAHWTCPMLTVNSLAPPTALPALKASLSPPTKT